MTAAMKVFGLAGWSGSGKTTLIVHLLPELIARGLRVSTIKHAHHRFERRTRERYGIGFAIAIT